MDKFRFISDIAWPFLLQAGQQQHKFNGQRLLEAALIAIATATVTSYANQRVVEYQFKAMEHRLTAHEIAMNLSQQTLQQIANEQARRTGAILYIEKLRDAHK